MKIAVSLSSTVSRLVWLGSALILFTGAIGITLFWFVISVIANPAIPIGLPAINSAANYFPNSARLQARLAAKLIESRSETNESQVSLAGRAFRHAWRAVQLSPENHENRLLLAAAAELQGDMELAETSLREAVRLAPSDIHVRWQMANLLLRVGKIDESLEEFRVVAAADQLRLPIVMNLLWQVTNGNFETLDRTIRHEPQFQLALVQFLTQHSQFEMAAQVFSRISRENRLKLSGSGQFFDALVKAGQWQLAGKLWRDTVVGQGANGNDLFWNGSFDQPILKSLAQFDWQLAQSDYARLQITTGQAHSGQRALTIVYQGKDTTRLDGEAQHPILVKPGNKYRLEFFAKSEELNTPNGPQIAILRIEDRTVIASSAPAPSGSSGWQWMAIDFTAPANAEAVLVTVRQTPQFSYVEPTSGAVKFDDFSLKTQ